MASCMEVQPGLSLICAQRRHWGRLPGRGFGSEFRSWFPGLQDGVEMKMGELRGRGM
jgi:hypothetical protein